MLAAGSIAVLYLPSGGMPWLAAAAVAAWQVSLVAFVMSRVLLFVAAALASIALSAAAAALHADWQRRHVSLLAFAPSGNALPSGDPVVLEGVVIDDAAMRPEGGASVFVRVERVRWRAGAVDVDGGVALSVAGIPDPARVREWTRGRRIRAPATLRRPSRYLNEGVPDAERASARRGLALVGSVKSAALIEVIAPASRLDEALARVRAGVR